MERNKRKSNAQKVSTKEKLKENITVAPKMVHDTWTPEFTTVLKTLLSARFCAAIWNPISDCDETFNYWEPLHYILHKKGFQTWEYSPDYALRSYAYIWLHVWPIKIYNIFFQNNKIFEFFLLRCLLAFFSAFCDTVFISSVKKHFGGNAANILLVILSFSTGMFISSAAFLPSSFAMLTTALALSGWMYGSVSASVLFFACGAIVGWPFAAALGIPYAFETIFVKKEVQMFIKWSILSLVIFLLPVIIIDSYYYGKLVIAPLNIIHYNIFSDNGPELYGTEPLSFYFLNGFLNFNIAFVCAIFVLPIVLLCDYFAEDKRAKTNFFIFMTMYIWIQIFFTRDHKEERFLFPIYHLISLSAAVFVDYLQRIVSSAFHFKKNYISSTKFISIFFCLVFVVFSLSRTFAIFYNYRAPLDVYASFKKFEDAKQISRLSEVNVCVGREWYRFPSHFFLPDNKWRMSFIKSEFKGQLPKLYSIEANATSIIPANMNDMNLEEMDRYINVSDCAFLVDMDIETKSKYEHNYSEDKVHWKILYSEKFLDASRSSRFFRAYYVPFVSSNYVTYTNYNILAPVKHSITKSLKHKS